MPSIPLTQASIISLLTFALGLAIGHWLALQRDRRKELNDASRPVRDWLNIAARSGVTSYPNPPESGVLADFSARLSKRKQREFNMGIRQYAEAIRVIERKSASNELELHETTLPRDIAHQLLRYTKLK